MDIKNHKSGRAHRHFVAAPFVMAILVASLLPSFLLSSPVTPFPTIASVKLGSGQGFSFDDGTQVMAGQGGASFQPLQPVPTFRQGSALFASKGLMTLSVASIDVKGVDGAWYLSIAKDGFFTASALTAPVLLTDKRGERILVPVSYQWRGKAATFPVLASGSVAWRAAREVQHIPASFQREQERQIALLKAAPASSDRVLPTLLGFLDGEKKAVTPIDRLRDAVSDGPDAVSAALAAETFSPVTLLTVLSEQSTARWLQRELLPHLAKNADLSLLLSVHPVYANTARALPDAEALTARDAWVRAEILPLSDTLPEPQSALLVDRWEAQTKDLLAWESHSGSLTLALPLLLGGAQDQVQRLSSLHYPDRLTRYATAYVDLLEPYANQLSDTQKHILADLTVASRGGEESDASASSTSSSGMASSMAGRSSSSRSLVSPDQAVYLTREALRQVGALFTVETKVEAQRDGSVAVRDIVLVSSQGEEVFSFTYHPDTEQASDIVREGKDMPYPFDLGKLVEWVKNN